MIQNKRLSHKLSILIIIIIYNEANIMLMGGNHIHY